MLVIVETKDLRNSKCCIACVRAAGKADPMICEQCRGDITNHYTCPDCEAEEVFSAYDKPDFCNCGYFWPDVNFLKNQQDARVEFHLEEL